MIKILLLTNNQILVSQIEEVSAEIGEPDCKLTNPYLIVNNSNKTLEPWLLDITNQNVFMIQSDKIITITDPSKEIIENYLKLTAE